jgi:hypothetical protein
MEEQPFSGREAWVARDRACARGQTLTAHRLSEGDAMVALALTPEAETRCSHSHSHSGACLNDSHMTGPISGHACHAIVTSHLHFASQSETSTTHLSLR